ncbi:hypothetical protein B0H10DRAFT_1939023 [Mycena sp. CBHHK59/15]|nr:hypothetical protein B0H10DRAFT_1939023 [Mycena sp. CBHHK59/15]
MTPTDAEYGTIAPYVQSARRNLHGDPKDLDSIVSAAGKLSSQQSRWCYWVQSIYFFMYAILRLYGATSSLSTSVDIKNNVDHLILKCRTAPDIATLSKRGLITDVIEYILTPGEFLAWDGSTIASRYRTVEDSTFQDWARSLRPHSNWLSHVWLATVVEDWDNIFRVNSGIMMHHSDTARSYNGTVYHKACNGTLMPATPGYATPPWYGTSAPIHAYHRHINDTEEGDDSGWLHQLWVGSTWLASGWAAWEEESDSGVILDFLWHDSSVGAWGNQGYMQDNNAIAMCAMPGLATSGSLAQADTGVMDFG